MKGGHRRGDDTSAGDDEVRGDAGYRLPLPDGSGWMADSWGIVSGAYEAGGAIGALEIHGGEGNDRLYGGVLDDRIFGGAGNDFIAGGGGDDTISGDGGDDVLAGDWVLGSDAYDAVTRNGQTGYNDSLVLAAMAAYMVGLADLERAKGTLLEYNDIRLIDHRTGPQPVVGK